LGWHFSPEKGEGKTDKGIFLLHKEVASNVLYFI